MNKNHYVAIMAGGIGSRFWPMSRSKYPKQFLDILGNGKTLLQSTFERFSAFIPEKNIFIVTSEDYAGIVSEQLPQLPQRNIVGEPERKNTAACIAYISFKLRQLNPEANLIVAPSDHLIEGQEEFEDTCLKALDFTASNDAFVTLGIKPTHPNTGYGYIQHDWSPYTDSIHRVARFTEKPDSETAGLFLQEGNYLWNSGIFIWKVRDILNAFKLHMPSLYQNFLRESHKLNKAGEKLAVKAIYNEAKSISIDYAIMEKANNVFVIPSSFIWNDLGTWNSAWDNFHKDPSANAVNRDTTLMIDSNGCLVHSTEEKLIVVGGMENLIVVDTQDALLICNKENEQHIKDYVAAVDQSVGSQYL
jgi:mannose-1-phosphate guanylyltransferase